ncbi:sodium-independent sulfate anion transporter-like isoform X2 [Lycorma delicatula]|uniref:sodium-independent sulfate anion transporter-like isoform X2 n=1 Tax=Lycorma delicatula TaxID=130591 RepID=UPI003F514C68
MMSDIDVPSTSAEALLIPPECEKQCNQDTGRFCCDEGTLKRKLPILQWAPSYTLGWLMNDFIAGITVSLTAVPQGIAYAVVAGLDPAYGLYSGFVGAFIYVLFGTCKDITIGPTAILSLMTYKYAHSLGDDYTILLCFLSGVVILTFGLLRLGFVVEFISMPVTDGFTSAAAVQIAVSQIKNVLGLSLNADSFIDNLIGLYKHCRELQFSDTVMGLSTIIFLLLMKKLKDSVGNQPQNIKQKISWYIGVARNALVVVIGTLMAFGFSSYGLQPFKLTGHVQSGLPPFRLPPFQEVNGNRTVSFPEMFNNLGVGVIVIPLISILESISISKVFSKGKSLDATQEMIALGVSNVLGSFFLSMPVTGSFTRTALNHASGVVTPFGGFFTGIMILLSLSYLTPTFYYIPKASVAGVIICAMFYMVEYHAVPVLWRTKKADLVPLAATFISCLFIGLEFGMVFGITINLLFILYNSARPSIHISWITVGGEDIMLVTPTQSLAYPATEYLREVIINSCVLKDSRAPVIIDGTHIHYIDSTVAKGIKLLMEDLIVRKQKAFLWRWQKPVSSTVLSYDPGLAQYFCNYSTLDQLVRDSLTNTDAPIAIISRADEYNINARENINVVFQ